MKPNVTKKLAALLLVAVPAAAGAQSRPTLVPQREARPPLVQPRIEAAPATVSAVSPAALRAEARRVPNIAALSPDVRTARVRALLGMPGASLAATSMTVSASSAAPGVELIVYDAAMVDVSRGTVHAWVRSAEIDMDFPDGTAGRYVFDCPVWGTNAFAWQHGAAQGQAQVVDHHGLFVVDIDPAQRVEVTLKPQNSLVSWTGCEIIRVE